MKKIVIKYSKSMKKELENNEFLKYIGDSRVDMNPMYEINIPIPDNYEYVNLEKLVDIVPNSITL